MGIFLSKIFSFPFYQRQFDASKKRISISKSQFVRPIIEETGEIYAAHYLYVALHDRIVFEGFTPQHDDDLWYLMGVDFAEADDYIEEILEQLEIPIPPPEIIVEYDEKITALAITRFIEIARKHADQEEKDHRKSDSTTLSSTESGKYKMAFYFSLNALKTNWPPEIIPRRGLTVTSPLPIFPRLVLSLLVGILAAQIPSAWQDRSSDLSSTLAAGAIGAFLFWWVQGALELLPPRRNQTHFYSKQSIEDSMRDE